ncbi:hypothetical protein GCM10010989_23110 [Croceicoccus pelagius]|uniref:Glycoside hydrolase family 5 domain-containing protein n=2 Tax=Croceicoccus pelagius TaxID=1703341 RepID=A0A917DL83_9SPHN|nr:hypothetical protein GCM10010989_23110 [Croceicoccus pelagius]
MILGVQTHFSQGWGLDSLDKSDDIGTRLLRDEMPWSFGEKTKGSISFTDATAQKLDSACDRGFKLILTEIPTHDAYDGGSFVYSAGAQAAFATYVKAVADRWGGCIAAFEIGNEINGGNQLSFPSGYDPNETVVALMKAVHDAVKPSHPGIAILGGSTNMIGTGFQKNLFDAGMLKYVDGVAVHPYSRHADGLPLELARLRSTIDSYSSDAEIWATEFGHDTSDFDEAAAQALKSVTLMSAAHVDVAVWYALIEEQWYPNFGLYSGGAKRPMAHAIDFAQRSLLTRGRATQVDVGDDMIFAYRFGSDATVIWGAPQTLSVSGATGAYDYKGQALANAGSIEISPRPVVIMGNITIRAGTSGMVADTVMQYGRDAWKYFARNASGAYDELGYRTRWYDSVFMSDWDGTLALKATGGVPARTGSDPMRVVWRYTAPKAMQVTVKGCFAKSSSGDGIDVSISRNGTVSTSEIVSSGQKILRTDLSLAQGDRVEFVAGPNQTYGGDDFSFRGRIYLQGQAGSVACP